MRNETKLSGEKLSILLEFALNINASLCEQIHFQGKQLNPLCFSSFYYEGQLLKERICSPRRKFLLLCRNFLLAGFYPSEKQTGSHKCCFPL